MGDLENELRFKSNNPSSGENGENIDLAMSYLAVLDSKLTFFEKKIFIRCLGNFNRPEYPEVVFGILRKKGVLKKSHINLLTNCIRDQIARTQLIMRISASDILKVSDDF